MTKKTPLKDSMSIRVARMRRATERHRITRLLGGRAAAALLLGTALSVGGITETFDNVSFLVQKDLDAVRVVRVKGEDEKVVANLKGNFTGNTVFKLSQVLPDRYVSRELSMFDDKWIATEKWLTEESATAGKTGGVFLAEMKRINESLRAEFFAERNPVRRADPREGGKVRRRSGARRRGDRAGIALSSAALVRQVGARGLMQLMPRTGRWMGARDLYDPEQNVDAGVRYIKYLNKRFNGDLKKTIAAYNGGEGNVQRYRGVPPFRETRQYVKKVMKNYDKRTRQLEKYEQTQRGGSLPEADGSVALR
jgi:hypothetical protein